MSVWDQYTFDLTERGYTARERKIQAVRDKLTRDFEFNPSCKDVTIDDKQQRLIVVSADTKTRKNIYTLPNENFSVGSVVVYNGSHWLIISRDVDDDICVKGEMQLCNRQISWQNDSGDIIHRWVTASDTYSEAIKDGDIISYSRRQFKIQIAYDDETHKIGVDKRFMISVTNNIPQIARVIRVDDVTSRYDSKDGTFGFITLTLQADVYNEQTDNVELMIADYIQPSSTTQEVCKSQNSDDNCAYSIRCLNKSDDIILGGAPRRFAIYINNEQVDLTELSVEWSASSSIGDLTKEFHLDVYDDKTLSVSVDNNMFLDRTALIISAVITDINNNSYSCQYSTEVVEAI